MGSPSHFETVHKARVKLRQGWGLGTLDPGDCFTFDLIHSAKPAPARGPLPTKPATPRGRWTVDRPGHNPRHAETNSSASASPCLPTHPGHPGSQGGSAPPNLGAWGQAEGGDPVPALEDQRGQDPRGAHSPPTGYRLCVESLSPPHTHSQSCTVGTPQGWSLEASPIPWGLVRV